MSNTIQTQETIYEYDSNDDLLDSYIVSSAVTYDAHECGTYSLSAGSTWYQIPQGNVYTSQFTRIDSDQYINLNVNTSNTIISNTKSFECSGDVIAVYVQNTSPDTATITKKFYGTNGVRTVSPTPSLYNTVTVSASTTLLITNSVVLCDCAATSITITYPALVGADNGKSFSVKKIDTSVNIVTVVGAGTTLIDGASSLAWSTPNASYTTVWNGTGHNII